MQVTQNGKKQNHEGNNLNASEGKIDGCVTEKVVQRAEIQIFGPL